MLKWPFERLNAWLGLPIADWWLFPAVLLIGALYFGFAISMMRVANRANRWINKQSRYRNCPACGRRMLFTVTREYTEAGQHLVVDHASQGWSCPACDEAALNAGRSS